MLFPVIARLLGSFTIFAFAAFSTTLAFRTLAAAITKCTSIIRGFLVRGLTGGSGGRKRS